MRLDAFNRQQLNMVPLLTARKREEETKQQHRRMISSSHFTADERRKVVEEFLNNDEVVASIHRLLFKKSEETDLGKTDVFRSSNREPAYYEASARISHKHSAKHTTTASLGLIPLQDYEEVDDTRSKRSKTKLPPHSYKELQKLLGAKRGYIMNHTVKDGQLLLKKV